MNQLTITTTQNVAISFDNASIGDRILAFVIDMVIKILYVIAIVFLLELFRGDRLLRGMDNWSQVAMYLLIFSPVVFYTLFFEIFMQGRTPGKLVTKIKVIKIDGYQAQVGDYLIRWVFRLIDLLLSSGVIGILAIILTDKNQLTGLIPITTSLKVPPPIAVTNDKDNIPNKSKRFSIATRAPDTAKAMVPNKSKNSNMKKK